MSKKITTYNSIVALAIRFIREKTGKTQSSLAKGLKLSPAGWGKIEKGLSTISASQVMKFCECLDISISKFYLAIEKIIEELREADWVIVHSLGDENDLLELLGLEQNLGYSSALQLVKGFTSMFAVPVIGGVLAALEAKDLAFGNEFKVQAITAKVIDEIF